MDHISLIRIYCNVLAERGNAIWYEDGGFRYADIYDPEEGWVCYSCGSREEFDLFCEILA